MTNRIWRTEAKKRWGKRAQPIMGDGQFALLSHCRVLVVFLYSTRNKAEENKKFIDDIGCGGCCVHDHEVIDLNIALPKKTWQ